MGAGNFRAASCEISDKSEGRKWRSGSDCLCHHFRQPLIAGVRGKGEKGALGLDKFNVIDKRSVLARRIHPPYVYVSVSVSAYV